MEAANYLKAASTAADAASRAHHDAYTAEQESQRALDDYNTNNTTAIQILHELNQSENIKLSKMILENDEKSREDNVVFDEKAFSQKT